MYIELLQINKEDIEKWGKKHDLKLTINIWMANTWKDEH